MDAPMLRLVTRRIYSAGEHSSQHPLYINTLTLATPRKTNLMLLMMIIPTIAKLICLDMTATSSGSTLLAGMMDKRYASR
jgi:hypothetical protein